MRFINQIIINLKKATKWKKKNALNPKSDCMAIIQLPLIRTYQFLILKINYATFFI